MARTLATSIFDRAVLAIAAVFALAAATYAASFDLHDTETRLLARQQALEPPQLWQVDALDPSGDVTASVFVCADNNLRETFTRTRAEVNGEMCKDATGPVMKENGWALRCVAHGRPFAVSASTVGDPTQDFQLNFGLSEITYYPMGTNLAPVSVRQSRHFHRVGACPYGWRIGDQAKPGKKPYRA